MGQPVSDIQLVETVTDRRYQLIRTGEEYLDTFVPGVSMSVRNIVSIYRTDGRLGSIMHIKSINVLQHMNYLNLFI